MEFGRIICGALATSEIQAFYFLRRVATISLRRIAGISENPGVIPEDFSYLKETVSQVIKLIERFKGTCQFLQTPGAVKLNSLIE